MSISLLHHQSQNTFHLDVRVTRWGGLLFYLPMRHISEVLAKEAGVYPSKLVGDTTVNPGTRSRPCSQYKVAMIFHTLT